MYRLEVYSAGKLDHVEVCARAGDVLDAIPRLLKEHAGCERIVVMVGATALFSVDCQGNTRPG